MKKVKIITDSCADLTAEQLQRFDISYAQMSTVYKGKESPAKLTWTPEEAHEFYNLMRDGERITTAQVSVRHKYAENDAYDYITMELKYSDGQWQVVWAMIER